MCFGETVGWNLEPRTTGTVSWVWRNVLQSTFVVMTSTELHPGAYERTLYVFIICTIPKY